MERSKKESKMKRLHSDHRKKGSGTLYSSVMGKLRIRRTLLMVMNERVLDDLKILETSEISNRNLSVSEMPYISEHAQKSLIFDTLARSKMAISESAKHSRSAGTKNSRSSCAQTSKVCCTPNSESLLCSKHAPCFSVAVLDKRETQREFLKRKISVQLVINK